MHTEVVVLPADRYLAGWNAAEGQLFVPAFSHTRVGDEVALRVGLEGGPFRVTVLGKVTLVRRVGRPMLPPGAALALDPESRSAAGWLASAARGTPVSFQERPARFASTHRLEALRQERVLPVHTLNVSEDGAALRWPGPAPEAGDPIRLRLREGLLRVAPDAVVAWVVPAAEEPARVGVRVVMRGLGGWAWARLAREAAAEGRRV